ncbi:unnamed protein product, partial [marine sediment metagenome]
MGINGFTFIYRNPIQVKQSEHIGRNVVDNFETYLRRAGKDKGYIIAFSFSKGGMMIVHVKKILQDRDKIKDFDFDSIFTEEEKK